MTIVEFSYITTEKDFETAFAILGGYRESMNKSDYAETALNFHYRVATSENPTISAAWHEWYQRSRQALFVAIAAGYPEMDIWPIYDMWCECNESVAYCVDYLKSDMLRKTYDKNFCRIWHHQCNPDDCYMPGETPKEGDIYRNFYEWSAGN